VAETSLAARRLSTQAGLHRMPKFRRSFSGSCPLCAPVRSPQNQVP